MRAYNLTKVVALALSVTWLAGCGTSGSSTTDAGSTKTETSTGNDGSAKAVDVESNVSVSYSDVANLQRVFYFEFDKAVVQSEGFADLEKHAQYLANHANAQVVLEGHADERGTREYNMALGERRAIAISRFLQVNGVSAAQIETVSFGEEKPAMLGHSEASWSKNRRVVLKYVR